jgi:hypothetical protein
MENDIQETNVKVTTKKRFLAIAEVLDAFRLVPRGLLVAYGLMLFHVSEWFMALPDPSGSQSAFISTVWASSAAWSAFYLNSGRKWKDNNSD